MGIEIVLATNLKIERLHAGLTQRELAEKLKIPIDRYKKYECLGKGRRTPDIEIINQIADILKITTDDLFGRKPPN